MLAEYDLSQATRGRRHTHKIGPDLPGVQFLTNAQGQKPPSSSTSTFTNTSGKPPPANT